MEFWGSQTYDKRSVLYERPAGKLTTGQKKALKDVAATAKQHVTPESLSQREALLHTVVLDKSFQKPSVDTSVLLVDHAALIKQHRNTCDKTTTSSVQQHPLNLAFLLYAQEPKVTATSPKTAFLERECTLVFTGCDGHLWKPIDVTETTQWAGVEMDWFAISGKKKGRSDARVLIASTNFAAAMRFLDYVEKREAERDEKLKRTIEARDEQMQARSEATSWIEEAVSESLAAEKVHISPEVEAPTPEEARLRREGQERAWSESAENLPAKDSPEFFDAVEYLSLLNAEDEMEKGQAEQNWSLWLKLCLLAFWQLFAHHVMGLMKVVRD